ncbi:helix-turn-helix domain-containing protein [Alkalimarinus coralli]|uniref:helix-turn-helix domain-containing protein n=1 Tax=Alkalimarinus coralli TaxID=2935863 RepID=UPI00202B1A8D|nr:AraC family transcriptional regulator [Alkalimarinus coralli]
MKRKSLLYLSKKRTLFIGYIDEPLHLSQGAATLHFSLDKPFYVKQLESNKEFKCTSVLIPPGCSVLIDSKQQPTVNLNLDVMGEDMFHLSLGMKILEGELGFGLKEEAWYRSELYEIFANQTSLSNTMGVLDHLLLPNTGIKYNCDPRVQTVVDLIQNSIDQNISIEYLAEQVSLSVAGLTKLFKRQTGVPIRRYRQWHRLYITATEIGKGKTLTQAAQAAGFVDLPHCTHAFNLMFGMKPSYFLQRPEEIKIITEASENLKCLR